MNPQTQRQPRQQRGKSNAPLALLMAVVLGLGAYFGGIMLFKSQSLIDPLPIGDLAPVPDLPTDSEGNNLIGNSMPNLHAGGLMAMQGEDMFYANPADGGALYCRARDGEITKLTDFPVANLNVSGERLVFTDLEASTVIRADGRMETYGATSHEELWDEAGDEGEIRYGGHLYFILGVQSFCAGELSYEALTIVGLESEERYQSPIMMEGGDILVVAISGGEESSEAEAVPMSASLLTTPEIVPLSTLRGTGEISLRPIALTGAAHTSDSVMTIKQDGTMSKVNLDTSKGDRIQSAAAVGDSMFAETVNVVVTGDRGANMITEFDRETGAVKGSIPGYSLRSDGTNVHFINDDSIFKYDPSTGKITQVSGTPVDSTVYTVNPAGSVSYKTLDTDTGEFVDMTAVPLPDGGYTIALSEYADNLDLEGIRQHPNGTLAESMTLWGEIKRRGEMKFAHWFGGKYYGWDRDNDSWVEVSYADDDRTVRFMPWGTERRDRGPNAIKWGNAGELGKLFGGKGEAETEPPSEPIEVPEPPELFPADEPPEEESEAETEPETEPADGGTLDGTYGRVGQERRDYIEFDGDSFTWYVGGGMMVVRSGTYAIQGNELIMYLDQNGPQGPEFAQEFAQDGNTIQLAGRSYIKN